jgi:hypothetical protein
MAEQKVIDKAKAWADKEYDELRYSKCEKKHFVFTFHELREMGKQAFIAGHEAGADELRKVAEYQQSQNMERYFENERTRKTALLNLDGWRKSDAKLEKARALLEKWLQTELHYNAINAACEELVLRTETEQFLAGDL